MPISQSNVELYSQMHLSAANGKTEDGLYDEHYTYHNNAMYNNEGHNDERDFQMTPKIVKPPITHERGIPGLYIFKHLDSTML